VTVEGEVFNAKKSVEPFSEKLQVARAQKQGEMLNKSRIGVPESPSRGGKKAKDSSKDLLQVIHKGPMKDGEVSQRARATTRTNNK